MDDRSSLKRWVGIVRVATGGVFVYMSTSHLLGGVATSDGFQKLIGGMSRTHPLQPYTSVMVPIVLSAPGFLGPLFVFGMLAAGLGLLAGQPVVSAWSTSYLAARNGQSGQLSPPNRQDYDFAVDGMRSFVLSASR
jgi:hypothetical protein